MDERRETDRHIIESLLESLEQCMLLALTQKAVLTYLNPPDWEALVIAGEEIALHRLRAEFERFREILLLSSSENQLPTDWLQIVEALLDSVNDPDRGV